MSETGPGTTPTAGDQPNYWHEKWRCVHCGGEVTIRVTTPWPTQCPRCNAWQPRLEKA